MTFALIVVLAFWLMNRMQMHQQELTYTQFEQEVEDKNVTDAVIGQNKAVPTGSVTVTLKYKNFWKNTAWIIKCLMCSRILL